MDRARLFRSGLLSVGFLLAILFPALAAQPPRENVTLRLRRGDFTVYRYVPGDPKFAKQPRAVIVFGGGDGSFGAWENRVCGGLQAAGYEVLGWDCAIYATTDYDLDILQSDINTIAQSSLIRYGLQAPPLVLAGWSMGAAQTVAAAGGPHPPAGLVGLVLISPATRGRYGYRLPDGFNITPTGPGTFALADFAHGLDHDRVALWHADFDFFDARAWLNSLTAPHKAYEFIYGTHFYNMASDVFLRLLNESVSWVLEPFQPIAEVKTAP